MCTPHQPELPTESLPYRTQIQIRALKNLAALLAKARARLANADTALFARRDFAESMLCEVDNLLDHTQELVREQILAVRESGPRTSGTL
jgi:hypothetical protein